MTNIITELHDRIRNECTEVDADKAYDDFLDECYSFKIVGGPFAHMCASTVLEECDPVAYRCGFSDWLDSEDLVDIGVDRDEYYRRHDCEQERDKFIDELEADIEHWESQQDDIDEESETYAEEFADFEALIDDARLKTAELRKYVF